MRASQAIWLNLSLLQEAAEATKYHARVDGHEPDATDAPQGAALSRNGLS